MSRSSLLLVASALTLAACRGDLQATSDTGTASDTATTEATTSATSASGTSSTSSTTDPTTDSGATDSATGTTTQGSTGSGTTGANPHCAGAPVGLNFLPAVKASSCVGGGTILASEVYGTAGIDLVVNCLSDSTVHVFENNVVGKIFDEKFVFDAKTVAAEENNDIQLHGVAAFDIDLDQDTDLVVTTRTSLRWWTNNGTVGYGPAQRLQIDTNVNLWGVAGGQFGDERYDAVVIDRDGPFVTHVYNDFGNFALDPPPVEASIPGGAWSIEVGDLNLDGTADIVIPRNGTAPDGITRVVIWGQDAPEATYNLPSDPSAIWSHLMDVDKDGMLDVVVSHSVQGDPTVDRVFVFRNDLGAAMPGFTEVAAIAVADDLRGLDSGDLDCDGTDDLIVASLSGALYVLPGDGTSLGAPVEVATGNRISDVAVADFDEDGRDDFAYLDFDTADLSVRYGAK